MIQVIHTGIVENNRLKFDRIKLFDAEVAKLEGQRFELTLAKEYARPTRSQFAYYFGGIIKGTCMKTTLFEGWTYREIDDHIRTELRNHHKILVLPTGKEKVSVATDDIENYTKEEMTLFIDDVLNYLATLEIFPLGPDQYKYDKMLQYWRR